MATTKSSAKTSTGKRPAAVVASSTAKAKPAPKAKPATKPEPVAKAKAVPKAVPKAAPKPATKAVTAKAAGRSKKPAAIPLEKRKHYIEMAAYYIAERRGFAPGNLLDDWVQAEAEIDRLLAEGRLGS
ncbi:MAG: DUF2934 domain-containing protein [Sulfuritalea sp.]|nr:DUF2934 domain-containing protein [Sulfuritalea sp.]